MMMMMMMMMMMTTLMIMMMMTTIMMKMTTMVVWMSSPGDLRKGRVMHVPPRERAIWNEGIDRRIRPMTQDRKYRDCRD